jgi:hypothetical protein
MYLILSILNPYFKKLKHKIAQRVILLPSTLCYPFVACCLLLSAYSLLPPAIRNN